MKTDFGKRISEEYSTRHTCLNNVFAFHRMSSLVFGVFLNHWIIPENQARRREHFKKTSLKINRFLESRLYVFRFMKMYDRFRTQDLVDRNLLRKLRNSGLMLVMTGTVVGCCEKCGQGVTRFDFYRISDFILVCQNKSCKEVASIYFLPF